MFRYTIAHCIDKWSLNDVLFLYIPKNINDEVSNKILNQEVWVFLISRTYSISVLKKNPNWHM